MKDKEKSMALVPAEPKREIAVRQNEEISIGELLKGTLDKGITPENAATAEKLMDLYERMQDRAAEKQFAESFNALQAEMPKVQATKAVPNNDGTVRYKFAPFEEIMKQVAPMLQKHGFTVSFSSKYDQNRLIQVCTLQHVGGCKRTNEFAVRVGSGPPKASECQADGAAATYAKRFALTDCLNIVVGHIDDDATLIGAKITPEQAKELQDRVAATGTFEPSFLKYAGAKSFSEIPESKYAELDGFLRKRESTK